MSSSPAAAEPRKLRWGVLSVSKFAMAKLLPAVRKSERNSIHAIASRGLDRARQATHQLGASKAYGSYEELLSDPEIDVVYNPLPNHLHLEWTVKAAVAGKHVLCEKPLGMNAAEVKQMITARDKFGVQIMEAFMVRTHPQWLAAREIVRSGEIGEVRAFLAGFSYFNIDPANIRNVADAGGGAIYDIGCYCVTTSRFILEQEPSRVTCLIDRDPTFKTDRLASAILDYPGAQAIFTVSTQSVPFQRTQIVGTKGRIEMEIPVNALPDRPQRIFVDIGGALDRSGIRTVEFPTVDQYTVQADEFAAAVLGEKPIAVTLEDSLANMRVLDALLRSGASGRWETP